jgi:hypothetical protein
MRRCDIAQRFWRICLALLCRHRLTLRPASCGDRNLGRSSNIVLSAGDTGGRTATAPLHNSLQIVKRWSFALREPCLFDGAPQIALFLAKSIPWVRNTMIQNSSAICWAATTYKAVFHGEFDERGAVRRSGDRIYKSENGRQESRSMWLRFYCFIRGISTQGSRTSDPESPCASGQVTRFKAQLQSIRRATGRPLARGE